MASTDIFKIKENRRHGSVCMRFVCIVAVGRGGGLFVHQRLQYIFKDDKSIQRERRNMVYNGKFTWSGNALGT